jgi:hypothetical protein
MHRPNNESLLDSFKVSSSRKKRGSLHIKEQVKLKRKSGLTSKIDTATKFDNDDISEIFKESKSPKRTPSTPGKRMIRGVKQSPSPVNTSFNNTPDKFIYDEGQRYSTCM